MSAGPILHPKKYDLLLPNLENSSKVISEYFSIIVI